MKTAGSGCYCGAAGHNHGELGHEVMHLSADADGVTTGQQRRSHGLFQSEVAPVLREHIPSRPLSAQLAVWVH